MNTFELVDALQGVVGFEPEPEMQAAADRPVLGPKIIDAHTISTIPGPRAKSEPEHHPIPESKATPADAVPMPETEPLLQPDQVTAQIAEQTESVRMPAPEPQSEPGPDSTAAVPGGANPMPETESAPEPNPIAETIGSVAILEPEPQSGQQPNVEQDGDAATETKLTAEISELWTEHIELSGTRRATAKELRLVRARLGEKLYRMKSLLSRPGRGGEWRGWLKQQGIARSSADRWVARHTEMLGGGNELNVPSGAISQPAEADVKKLAKNTWQRIGKFLTTGESVIEFIDRFSELAGVNHEHRAEGLMIFKSVPEGTSEFPDSIPASIPVPQVSDGGSTDPEEAVADPVALPAIEQAASTGGSGIAAAL